MEISQFTQLLKKARKTTQSVQPSSNKPEEQKLRLQAIMVSIGEKRKKSEGREYESPPPIPCTPKKLDTLGQLDCK